MRRAQVDVSSFTASFFMLTADRSANALRFDYKSPQGSACFRYFNVSTLSPPHGACENCCMELTHAVDLRFPTERGLAFRWQKSQSRPPSSQRPTIQCDPAQSAAGGASAVF